MNTTKIGDEFEKKCKDLITSSLNKNELGLSHELCTIYEKKKYYSSKRDSDIIFDLSIELKPENAERPFLVCLIECKSLNKAVPVDDIEEFESKVDGLKGFQTKKIFISRNGYQKGAFNVAKNLGITLIDVNENDYNIILYKSERRKIELSLGEKLQRIVELAFIDDNSVNLDILSAKKIDDKAVEFLKEIDLSITSKCNPTPINRVIDYLHNNWGIKTKFEPNLLNSAGYSVLGYYDSRNKIININDKLKDTLRYPFVFAHELGHIVLHKDISIHQLLYDGFEDSSFNFFQQKHSLKTAKDWIEWQANAFAASFLMPENSIKIMLIAIQKVMGIRNRGSIYLDHQEVNRKDFKKIIEYLSEHFMVANIHVEYRLYNLGLVIKPKLSEEDEEKKEWLRELSKRNIY